MIGIFLRFATLLLLIIWRVYWFLHKEEAALKKPKTENNKRLFEQILIFSIGFYVIINLLGYVVFQFTSSVIQIIGFIFVCLGVFESMTARKTLDDNWTESYEYQIKKNHELITQDVYRYVRHPIYGGLLLMVPGALMVSGTYIFILFLAIMFAALNIFANREEKILKKHFGKKYLDYMKTTKKLIPFIY